MAQEEILLVYDKECPACDHYCRVVRVRESVGQLTLINARDEHEVNDEITKLGLDIDQGMVLKMGGKIYYGPDAIHALALISSRSDIFNRLNHWIFKSKKLSRILYPALKFFRNILLKILKVKKINNLSNNDREYF